MLRNSVEPAVDEFRAAVGGLGSRFGLASIFVDFGDTQVAAMEAEKVLSAGNLSGGSWMEFEGSTLAVLTRPHQEAREIISGASWHACCRIAAHRCSSRDPGCVPPQQPQLVRHIKRIADPSADSCLPSQTDIGGNRPSPQPKHRHLRTMDCLASMGIAASPSHATGR